MSLRGNEGFWTQVGVKLDKNLENQNLRGASQVSEQILTLRGNEGFWLPKKLLISLQK